jgi:hypothetical protein
MASTNWVKIGPVLALIMRDFEKVCSRNRGCAVDAPDGRRHHMGRSREQQRQTPPLATAILLRRREHNDVVLGERGFAMLTIHAVFDH